jgi:hypothetical protein
METTITTRTRPPKNKAILISKGKKIGFESPLPSLEAKI